MTRNSDFTKLVQKSLNKQQLLLLLRKKKTTTIKLEEGEETYLLSGPVVKFKMSSLQQKIKR